MNITEMIAHRMSLRPESGYNVVGVDTYGSPDEQGAYVAGNYQDEESAFAACAALQEAAQGQEDIYLVSADGTFTKWPSRE